MTLTVKRELSCNCVILSIDKWCQMDLINKTVLVPDSSRTTERNGHSLSADVTDDIIGHD